MSLATGAIVAREPILVVGASGQVGGRIVRLLVRRGRRVHAAVRSDAQAVDVAAAGATPVRADLRDPKSLGRACRGVGTVVVTATAIMSRPPDTLEAVDDRGIRALIQEAVAAGAARFVLVSADIARADSPHALGRAKAAAEAALEGSGLDWTILAPDMFMESWVAAVVTMPAAAGQPVFLVEGAPPHAFVAEADVAAIAVAALGAGWTTGRRLPVGGPDVLDWASVVGLYEQVAGTRVDVHWLSGDAAQARQDHLALLLEHGRTDPPELRRSADRLGVPLMSVADWLAAQHAQGLLAPGSPAAG